MRTWQQAKGKGISLLVPFRADSPRRRETWAWLDEYWRAQLPKAQLIVSTNDRVPFAKTMAVNSAFKQATGDIIVILDADCYISAEVILECAIAIRSALKLGQKLWYIPYRQFYRLTNAASLLVLDSCPKNPRRFPTPPPNHDIEQNGTSHSSGHWYGALIQIMPREAFITAGGMDLRFDGGWGGEDVSFMNAVDTLYARHKTTCNQVLHLWHPTIGGNDKWKSRMWAGQVNAQGNDALTWRYNGAFGLPDQMQRLVNESGHGH